ncbi:general secretion pathway protein GspK [Bdellovibrio sp. ZAP7]|uniref:general secretion pathway protein GspK n=1 Tax=Bdellovibrio sp. ZAP7 TaxID=2231053 RepID=UPI001FEFD544|nr:type II secretion system protein GspK [Bdellovibrio sp. ZAP7]
MNIFKPLRNRRGMALIVVTACLMFIMYFATELVSETRIEYEVNSAGLNRIKAYYAAKSGMQLALLRVKIYQQAQSKFGAQLGSNSPLLNMIWQFPFAWPLPVPDELTAIDKDAFKKLTKESAMDASYITTIEDEGSKIDINDLTSPSETLRKVTKQQLLNIFQQKMKEDEAWGREHSNTNFEKIINNIADYMSDKATSANGGDKRANYANLNSEAQSDYFPPNRAFRTLSELHFVPEMTDDLYDLIEPRITIYGMKGINPNIASKEVLKSLDPGMTEEVVTEIIKRRDDQNQGGPFKDAADFWNFVQSKNARLEGKTDEIPLVFDSVFNFRIRSTGEFARSTSEITVITMDFNKTVAKIKDYVDKDKKAQNPNANDPNDPANQNKGQIGQQPGNQSGNQQQKADAISKGPPRIVYWSER